MGDKNGGSITTFSTEVSVSGLSKRLQDGSN